MTTLIQKKSREYNWKARQLNASRWNIQSIKSDSCATQETKQIANDILDLINTLQESMHTRQYHLDRRG